MSESLPEVVVVCSRPNRKSTVRKSGVFNPFEALRRAKKADATQIATAKSKLKAAFTRVFLGTATDEDFGTLATYLLYGAVLAENFEDIRPSNFSRAILQLRVAKRMISRKLSVPRAYISEAYSEFQVAVAMVFDLTVGEQIQLRDYIRENGQRLIDSIQTPEAVLGEEKSLKQAIADGKYELPTEQFNPD